MTQSLTTWPQRRRAETFRAGAHAPVLWLASFAATVSLTVGCRQRDGQTIKDSDGRAFTLACRHRECEPRLLSAPQSDGGSAVAAGTFRIESSGRVVGVCGPNSQGAAQRPSDCRPIVCESPRDCPPAEGLNEGVCINQLCTEPSHPLTSSDAVMLCLAGTGVGPTTPHQVERLALGLNCGKPCRVPTPCRQP